MPKRATKKETVPNYTDLCPWYVGFDAVHEGSLEVGHCLPEKVLGESPQLQQHSEELVVGTLILNVLKVFKGFMF